MLRATQVRPAGPQMNGPYETITLDPTARHRRRMAMKSDGGLSFLLDLNRHGRCAMAMGWCWRMAVS